MLEASTSVRERTALVPTAVLLSGLAACAYLYDTDPHEPGHLLPACPFRLVTGWQCPACGGTRMAFDLLHGDVARAWRDNAFVLLLSPFLLWLLASWVVAGWRGRRYQVSLPRYGAPVVVVGALAWGVLRNLP
jgi:hypothetical protein